MGKNDDKTDTENDTSALLVKSPDDEGLNEWVREHFDPTLTMLDVPAKEKDNESC